ncbi:TonB-dependent receptor [Persicobacter sp. CCB-QB2]|uniref:SusC/RagA family TonB-linked outer membrane protein n=1 Tax=Persicobacter sp. CCB-QB2 TaxID=1561025 RepID=UPI00092EB3A5|nr:TonB-dependent receptor [Persicobacter sp. CCB-QB2]
MKRIIPFLLLLLFCLAAEAQSQHTVSGTIKSIENGEPLPGVNVMVKDTSIGTVTNVDGYYSLSVPNENVVLLFTFIGLESQELSVQGRSVLDVDMEADLKELEEVVVTGYTDINKKRLSGSISSIDASEIESVPMPSFDQVLQGKAAGLYVNAGSGQPGAAATVRIRGNGSILGGNTPLFVMDGVPIEAAEFAALNANDFESVSVLKDASATSLYGSRGANGVIVITSKKGKVGKTKFNYSGQFGVSEIGDWKYDMMNTEERLQYEEMVQNGPGWDFSPNNPERPSGSDNSLDSLRQYNTNWLDVVTRTGFTQQHQLSAQGGKEQTRFFISGGYLEQQGVGIGSALERITGRVNIAHEASKRLRFNLVSSVGYSQSDFLPSESLSIANPFASTLNMPYQPPLDAEGNYTYGPLDANPLEWDEKTSFQEGQLKTNLTFDVSYDFYEGFSFKSKIGLDYRSSKSTSYISPDSQPGSSQRGQEGSYGASDNKYFKYIWLNSVTYTRTIGDHDFSGGLYMELIRKQESSFGYSGFGLNSKLPNTPAAITPGTASNGFIPTVGGGNTENALNSYFFIGNYTYKSKYNLALSARRDGSSKFGQNNRWANLWSVGASWNISEEDFFGASWVNSLKLKASYGKSGNQDDTDSSVGDFQSVQTFVATSTYAGVSGIYPASVGNPDLQWEISNQLNVGLDYSIFKDRISGSFEAYNNITSDLFLDQKLSATAGFTSVRRNAGKMRNRGVEITLNTTNVSIGDFLWTTNLNYAYNDNEILDLGQVTEFEFGTSLVREGYPLGSHYSVGWAGVNPANGQPLYLDQFGNPTPIFNSSNATSDWGTSNPPHVGGMTNTLTFKGIEFSFFFNFQAGHTLFNNQSFFIENHNVPYNQSTVMLTMWQEEGDVTNIPSPRYQRQFTSQDIEDASFLRLRNVTLGYNFPRKLISRIRLDRLKIYLQGQNLYTWTEFTGFDPEIGNNIAQFQYPTPKIYTLGIDVGF